MPVNLSIKNVPDEWVERLRSQAARHHRSLQGELMAILERTVASRKTVGPHEILAQVRARGLQTPAEAVDMVRIDRDRR